MVDSVSELAGSGPDLKKAKRVKNGLPEKLPPNSLAAEQGVIGCVLASPKDCLMECIEKIGTDGECFYDLRHQEIYKHIIEIFNEGKPIDIISLQQKLKDYDILDQCGGTVYLSSLQDSIPSTANLSYYLDVVIEKFILRKTIGLCSEVAGRIYCFDGNVDELMDGVERDILSLRNFSLSAHKQTNKAASLSRLQDWYEKAFAKKQPIGLKTGFADLDEILGGMMKQQFIVIAANTSIGKSSLGMNIIQNLAERGEPVGVFSLEMSEDELNHRLACTIAGVDGSRILRGKATEEDVTKLARALAKVNKLPIFIDDEGGLTISKLSAKARRMVQQNKVSLILIDYLQLINYGKKTSSIREDVTKVSNGLKQLAKELNIPLIIVSQLSRDASKHNRRPRLSDLRESGSIEQDADKAVFLHIEEEDTDNDILIMSAIVAKNRGGPTRTCRLRFRKRITKFECIASEENDNEYTK